MRHLIAPVILLPLAGPALAHGGHLADVAGHDHWVAGVAIGVAVAVGIWGAIKGRGDKTDPEPEPDTDPETEEQPA